MVILHSWAYFVIAALTVCRLTRLITTDSILTPIRRLIIGNGVVGRFRRGVALWVQCPWCVSPYVAAGVVVAFIYFPRDSAYVGAVLAFSYLAGLPAGRE
jgi:hypothetical protein